ncbi:MAG TPA: sulfatase-like hydrolase/transferase [Bacteroidales bacterium]|nr:sulfatase-like hydrolase/transferase [Bacteroidales bacterium]
MNIKTNKNWWPSFLTFWGFASFFYGLFVVSLNYTHFPFEGIKGFATIIAHWALITASSGIIIYCLFLNRWAFALLFPIFTTITGIIAYFIFQYDISINTAVIQSTFNTNLDEASGQISLQLILYQFFIITISGFIAFRRFKVKLPKPYWVHWVIIILGLLAIKCINNYRFNTIYQRNPFSLYLGLKNYQRDKLELSKTRIDISKDAECHEDSITVIVVIGEALRADHVSLNGYYRSTFDKVKAFNPVSFPNIYSEWTHTLQSVPHILTRADSSNHKPSSNETSFISVFRAVQFKTWWIGNQDLSLIALPFAKECDSIFINEPYKSDYSFTGKYDGQLLPQISKAINSTANRKLIVVQQVGCHWWYPSYYPPEYEIFKPSIKTKSFNVEDKQKIINAYDNAICYTDFFLSEILKKLSKQKAILFFLADHGELLGENGKWLHAQDTEYEKNPACFIWASEKYQKAFPEKMKALKTNQYKRFRTDFLFHSVLDAAEISLPLFQNTLSIFE